MANLKLDSEISLGFEVVDYAIDYIGFKTNIT